VVDCLIMPDHRDVQNHGGIWRASVVVVMGNLWVDGINGVREGCNSFSNHH
jgi:hypothetical protein